jgi:hypothetical protein
MQCAVSFLCTYHVICLFMLFLAANEEISGVGLPLLLCHYLYNLGLYLISSHVNSYWKHRLKFLKSAHVTQNSETVIAWPNSICSLVAVYGINVMSVTWVRPSTCTHVNEIIIRKVERAKSCVDFKAKMSSNHETYPSGARVITFEAGLASSA